MPIVVGNAVRVGRVTGGERRGVVVARRRAGLAINNDMGAVHGDELVRRARAIAIAAHAGQFDKAGRPYIEHPERVAARLEDPLLKAAALLHDVLEDTNVSADDLRRAGIPGVVVEVVEVLTKKGEDHVDAVRRAVAHPLARQVKLADVRDNSDEGRLALLDDATAQQLRTRYARALAILDTGAQSADEEDR